MERLLFWVFGLLVLLQCSSLGWSQGQGQGQGQSQGQSQGQGQGQGQAQSQGLPTSQDLQAGGSQGYRLSTSLRYFLVAPRRVRPNLVYQAHVTLYALAHDYIDIRVTLSRDDVEYASGERRYYETGTKTIHVQVPDTVSAGNHKLIVEGMVNVDKTGVGQKVFRNETKLDFYSKYVSIFVQTDKPMYYPEQTVYFRVLGVYPGTLKPAYGPMVIFVKDAKGNTVQRWLSYQLNFGMFESSFQLTYPVNVGTWSIQVEAFGHTYKDYNFVVDFFFLRTFHVNVTTPLIMTDTEWGVAGSIYGEHMSGKASSGNCTISLRVRNEDGTFLPGELVESFSYMTGTFPFKFTMSAIRGEFGEVAGKDLYFDGRINDYYWLETQNGTSVTRVIKDGVKVRYLGRRVQTFKPRTPVYVYFIVESTDGTPYTGHRNRLLTVQRTHHNTGTTTPPEDLLTIPGDGVVRCQVTPLDDDRKITVFAWHDSNPGDILEIELYRYHSKNDRYLSVTTSTKKPRVDEYMIFTLRTNFYVPEVNYLISAADEILLSNKLIMSRGSSSQKTFSVAVSRQMAPRARLVMYCLVEGEILTDSINFFVEESVKNTASISVNLGKDFKQDTIEIIGRGDAGGFIGLNGMDYEFYRRGAATFFNREKLLEELSTYDAPNEGPYHHIWWYNDDRWEESVFFTSPNAGMDLLTTFKLSGLVALSDTNLTVIPETHTCNATLGLGRCLSGQCFELVKQCDGLIDCEDGTDEIGCGHNYTTERKPAALKDLGLMPRYFSDSDWMWKTSYIKPTGQVELKLDVPKATTNPYVMSAFVIHPEHGLSIVSQVAQYDSTKQFFMYAEAPSTARRGEQIGVRLLLYSIWDQHIECIVMLHAGADYRFIKVGNNGYVSSYDPPTESGDIQTMVQLAPGEQKYVHMPVLPIIESGEITIVVSAYTFIDHDIEELSISISFDGVGNGDYMPYLVDLVNQGSVIIPDFDIPIPERFIHPEQRELIYLPGSNEAVLQVFGDVVSPGFFDSHLSTDSTMGMPHDSAEGYMFDFAINLQTLNFLQATNTLDDDKLASALKYMQSVLMRQYAYMEKDGSFKQFRRTEKPCVWLTSFILRTLHGVKTSEWDEQLWIPVETLNKIANWLVSQQNKTTGAFVETSNHIYNRDFEPWTTDNDGVQHEWHIPVTAHVTITLAGCTRLSGEAKSKVDSAKFLAADYLAGKIDDITDPYQMSVVAYALHTTAHREREQAYVRLKTMRREGEFVYWAHKEIPSNPVIIVNTVPLMQARGYFTNEGNAVVATAYALRLYLAHNELRASRPIMKWLQTQHNDFMRFSSTQDSLIALEALTDYALRETNRQFYRMDINFVATSNKEWKHKVVLNGSNFAEFTEILLPRAWGQIKAYAQGTGYAYIGVGTNYNTEHKWQVSGPDFEAYDFSVETMSFTGRNASAMDLRVCTKWLRPDLSPVSGMMNVLIDIPTGHVVARDAIEDVYRSQVPGLKRVRFRDQSLIVFFEYLTTTRTCFTFRAHRWYPVANVSIAHAVNLYEYAETGTQYNTQYNTFTLFHLHICQVCGSFQCPYCQYYNGATVPGHSAVFFILPVVVHVILSWFIRKPS